jgi:low affinity Fe/Cu permease
MFFLCRAIGFGGAKSFGASAAVLVVPVLAVILVTASPTLIKFWDVVVSAAITIPFIVMFALAKSVQRKMIRLSA